VASRDICMCVAVAALAWSCRGAPEPEAEREHAAPVASSRSSAPTPGARAKEHAAGERVTHEDKAMGTHVELTAFTTSELDARAVKAALVGAVDEIRRLEALMTTWRDDSEISRVNAAAGKAAVKVSPETLAVVLKSNWMSAHSEGVFDISFEAMHGLWKFDQDLEEKVPDAQAIEAARKLIDWRAIEVDETASTVKLARPGMRISLCGIAKGYAVDVAARSLERAGVHAFFVQAGGDLFVRGKKPDGAAFRVGVRDPRDASGGYFAYLPVEDHAFSTAGDYERSFVKDGKRYHHIIDPRTGWPATASRSVTIWAKDAFTADALDDSVFILGPEKGLALIESIDDAGCVIVDAKNKVWVSKRLEGKLQMTRPPTDGI
jgi:thiamine biosynthesis lipoprotein